MDDIASVTRALYEAEVAGDTERATVLLARLVELHRARISQ
ncbi:MAG: hypothetical protein RBS17_01580 [Coriobacteriia bacterium]|jgi:hypothetical protein|nr:hypothetical protein [Coriobacteriia bacterium]